MSVCMCLCVRAPECLERNRVNGWRVRRKIFLVGSVLRAPKEVNAYDESQHPISVHRTKLKKLFAYSTLYPFPFCIIGLR